jgi:isocitrate lyase
MSKLSPEMKLEAEKLRREWETSPRWKGIQRDYTAEDVVRLRPSLLPEQTLAKAGALRLWELLHTRPYVNTFGAYTGAQAVQMVKAGLEAIYLSGWQVAADANLAWQTYPDQSLYPANSVPAVVKRINNALMRADQIERAEGKTGRYWYAPIVADAEAGFGGPLNAFELMKSMIEAGAAAVHWEDQLSSEKKCGHLGGKVLIPTSQHIRTLNAARLAADVMGCPPLSSHAPTLRPPPCSPATLTSATSPLSKKASAPPRASTGFAMASSPASPAPWPTPPTLTFCGWRPVPPTWRLPASLPRRCMPSIRTRCWPTTARPASTGRKTSTTRPSPSSSGSWGPWATSFSSSPLAGWHNLNYRTFELAKGYKERGMSAFVELQQLEFAAEKEGFTAVKHQREVGAGYFDEVLMAITAGQASTAALAGSTEEAQFH